MRLFSQLAMKFFFMNAGCFLLGMAGIMAFMYYFNVAINIIICEKRLVLHLDH